MTNLLLTLLTILIGVLISVITGMAKRFEKKLDEFQVTIQEILLGDMEDKKDIERIDERLIEHHGRIEKLENKRA